MAACVCTVVDTNIVEAARGGRPLPCGQLFLGAVMRPDGEVIPAMWLCHAGPHGIERPHDCSQAVATQCCGPKLLPQKTVQAA